MALIGCDGCNAALTGDELKLRSAIGHVMRYCAACADLYDEFFRSTEAVAAKYQALLDIEERELRERCPLRLTPLDLPKLILSNKKEAVTLG